MEQELYKLLIEYGGSTAIIVAIIFLLKEMNLFLKNRSNNNISERLEKLESNDLHSIQEEINTIQKDIKDLTSRVSSIEIILKMKKIIK